MNNSKENNFVIAFASGKGGTGKTSVALNTAKSLLNQLTLLDCDVEEPNCAIFIKGEVLEEQKVAIFSPSIDKEKCNGCGECSKFCERKALVCWGSPPICFPEMCSGCGGCKLVCPINAIDDGERIIGKIEKRSNGKINLFSGIINIGEESPVSLVKRLRKMAPKSGLVFIDAPPGTSCPTVMALHKADYVVLVTEETPFGLSDLKILIDLVKKLNIKMGAVNNRKGMGKENLKKFLEKFEIPLLCEIPFDKEIFDAYSQGELIVDKNPKYNSLFKDFGLKLLKEVEKAKKENERQ
ncbi:MAG: 4Fe-4S binding protein [Thermoanaerobaculaceae bacterium]|nr:4Fe-4S binding protein [Thermoanaerobaculaceae bacterium]